LVVMSKGTRYTQQSYKVSDAFPFEWIKKKWKENFYITSMATAGEPQARSCPWYLAAAYKHTKVAFLPLLVDTRRYTSVTCVCSCLDCGRHLSEQQESGDNKPHLL